MQVWEDVTCFIGIYEASLKNYLLQTRKLKLIFDNEPKVTTGFQHSYDQFSFISTYMSIYMSMLRNVRMVLILCIHTGAFIVNILHIYLFTF